MEAIEFHVAGVKFHKFRDVKDELKEGMNLELVPEPTNRFDKNAVKILHNGVMLGYVPMKDKKNPGVLLSKDVSATLCEGSILNTTIIELNPDFEPWLALKVRIEEKHESYEDLDYYDVEEGDH
jgi:hypothetical protein